MFNIGPGELLAILMVALIVLGPQRLPSALRSVGRLVGELRRISGGFQEELRRAMDEMENEDDDDAGAGATGTQPASATGPADVQATDGDEPGRMQLPTDLPPLDPLKPPPSMGPSQIDLTDAVAIANADDHVAEEPPADPYDPADERVPASEVADRAERTEQADDDQAAS